MAATPAAALAVQTPKSSDRELSSLQCKHPQSLSPPASSCCSNLRLVCRNDKHYIILPSHENFPEMFVSTCDITTCEAFDRVVWIERGWENTFCGRNSFSQMIAQFYLDADAGHWKSFHRLRFFWSVAKKFPPSFVPFYRIEWVAFHVIVTN